MSDSSKYMLNCLSHQVDFLGAGGNGIVMRAKSSIDNTYYAVRLALPYVGKNNNQKK
jgi:hypothetical protein